MDKSSKSSRRYRSLLVKSERQHRKKVDTAVIVIAGAILAVMIIIGDSSIVSKMCAILAAIGLGANITSIDAGARVSRDKWKKYDKWMVKRDDEPFELDNYHSIKILNAIHITATIASLVALCIFIIIR